MSRRRGRQHLKHVRIRPLKFAVGGAELVRLEPGEPIRCGTMIFEMDDGHQYVFADYRFNEVFNSASGLECDECNEIDEYH